MYNELGDFMSMYGSRENILMSSIKLMMEAGIILNMWLLHVEEKILCHFRLVSTCIIVNSGCTYKTYTVLLLYVIHSSNVFVLCRKLRKYVQSSHQIYDWGLIMWVAEQCITYGEF